MELLSVILGFLKTIMMVVSIDWIFGLTSGQKSLIFEVRMLASGQKVLTI